MGADKKFSTEANKDPSVVSKKTMTSVQLLQFLKDSTEMYREANKKMDAIVKTHSLSEMKNDCYDILEQLCQLQLQFDTKELNTEAVTLSFSQKVRQFDTYSAKLKLCINMYLQLNEKLAKDIKTMQSALEQSESELDGTVDMSKDQMKIIEAKIQRYENDLIKLETKYPWLKDDELDIVNIAKEMETLKSLREKKEKLIKELDVYSGLEPDIAEATRQIEQLKLVHDELNRKVMGNV